MGWWILALVWFVASLVVACALTLSGRIAERERAASRDTRFGACG